MAGDFVRSQTKSEHLVSTASDESTSDQTTRWSSAVGMTAQPSGKGSSCARSSINTQSCCPGLRAGLIPSKRRLVETPLCHHIARRRQ